MDGQPDEESTVLGRVDTGLLSGWTCVAATGAKRTRYNEIPKYNEGLYDLGDGLYAWMVPNGSWGESNAGLIVGDGASLLVDTLWDIKYTGVMLDTMRPYVATAPLRTVVNTHADGDHWWGNQLVEGAEIITSQASYDEMLKSKPRSLQLLGEMGRLFSAINLLGADKVGHWYQALVAPYDFREVTPSLPTRTFEGELVLDVGGREVHLIQVGPAHTQGDLLVYVPEAKTLYSGDILFMGSTPVVWAGPVADWITALDKILEMDVDIIVPGHGPITGKSGAQQVKAYWETITVEVGKRFEAGMSAKDAAYHIVRSDSFSQGPFAGWNSPERLMTNAHTIYRHLEGRGDRLTEREMLFIMRKQAMLAHALPDAQPAVMRKR